MGERRTVVRDEAGACGGDDTAADTDGLCDAVDFCPLFGGERGGSVHDGGDRDEGDGRIAAE